MDEPTAAMDLASRRLTCSDLTRRRDEHGSTNALITHNVIDKICAQWCAARGVEGHRGHLNDHQQSTLTGLD